MKRVLSLLLAMAIVLSCFATCMVFSVSAAETDYLNVLNLASHNWNYTNRLGVDGASYANGDPTPGVKYDVNNAYHAEPGENYVSEYFNTYLNAAPSYSGHFVFSSNNENNEVFKNNVSAPEYFRFQPKLAVTQSDSVILYVEIPDYEAVDETWGFGLYKPSGQYASPYTQEFVSTGNMDRYFRRSADITEGFSYLSVDSNKWVNGTMYKVADGEKVMKTDLPSGFKGYIRFDLSKIPIVNSADSEFTDVAYLNELQIAFNAVGSSDFVVGGLMYATSNSDSTILNFNGNALYQLAGHTRPEYIKVSGLSGNNWELTNKQGIDGTSKPAGDEALGVTYEGGNKTYHAEAGENYVSSYPDSPFGYSGAYILSSKNDVFINDVTAPEYFRFQSKLPVTNNDSVIMYVEIPNYAEGQDWGFGLYQPSGKWSAPYTREFVNTGDNDRFFRRSADITEGFSYLPVDGKEWVNGTMYKVADGEKVMKTDLPSGFKGYIRFDLSKIPIVTSGDVEYKDLAYLNELQIAYNNVGAGDFVIGGLMYKTTNADAAVLNFNDVGYIPMTNEVANYIEVSSLSGNNWNITAKQAVDGNTDAAFGVTYEGGNKTYHAEPGENYVSNYLDSTFGYSGTYIFSSKEGKFKNNVATPEYFRFQSKLNVTNEQSVIMYVEVPDYEAAGEMWGFGLYKPTTGEFAKMNGDIEVLRYFKRDADITEGFSYLSVDSNKWVNGTMYKVAEGEKVMKTDLPSGFKGYVRFDLSKFSFVNGEGTAVEADFTFLKELQIAYNGVGTDDNFVLGGLMYATSNSDSTVLNFDYWGFSSLTNYTLPEYIKVSGLSGHGGLGARQGKNGATTGVTFDVNYTSSTTYHAEPGAKYLSDYTLVQGYNGAYILSAKEGTFDNTESAPEYFRFQSKLPVTNNDSVIMYVEIPNYAEGDWGFGLYKPTSEFLNANSNNRYFKRDADITEGFSYLPVDGKEWINGTIFAQVDGENVVKTDLPSGFKGYIRFDLSKMTIVNIYNTPCDDVVTLQELDIAYNNVGAGDFVIGGLMYKTTSADDLVFNFNDNGFVPLTNNILSVRAQNLITDKANTTNATGTNIKLVKGGSEADTTAVMKLAKSGGLFLDDGYAASFTPIGTIGGGILKGTNVSYYNSIKDDNLGLQLKAGVNKFMFYVELPDVRDFEGVTDEHNALAMTAIYHSNNSAYVTPYGLTYEFMDIRDGKWVESTIGADGTTQGAFLGLPTDGFKGYIKIDLSSKPIPNNAVISTINLRISRFSWGRPLVVGGFYAIDIDSSAETPYFMDTVTGEMATTKVVPGDFSGNEKYDSADLVLAIKYLIKHNSLKGIQTARASDLDNIKADFTVVSLVKLKKAISGLPTGFSIDKDLEASTSEADVALLAQNPDRGFRMKSFVSIEEDPARFDTINLTQWDGLFAQAADETTEGVWVNPKINKVYFRLDEWVGGQISEGAFTNIQKVFDVTKKQGKTLIVRFYYADKYATVTNAQMLDHINQIKNNGILAENADMLNSVEAGFLGQYGEWHSYYDDFWTYKKSDATLDVDAVWNKQGFNEEEIIAAVLDMVPSEVPVLLRTSIYRDKFLASTYANEGDDKRLGLHTDSFFALENNADAWPYQITEAKESARDAAALAPMSGEFYWGYALADMYGNDYTISGTDAILAFKYYRQNTFSVFHNSWEGTQTVSGGNFQFTTREGDMAKWAQAEITEAWLQANNVFYAPGWFKDAEGNTVERTQYEFVRDYLGYKLEAKHLKVTGSKARGGKVNVVIDLVNYGFSAPFNMTSEIVILDSDNKIVSSAKAGNALDWVNIDDELKTHKINATITLPETAGKYRIALYVHNRAGTGAYLGNNIEQVDGFNILATFGIQ